VAVLCGLKTLVDLLFHLRIHRGRQIGGDAAPRTGVAAE
jgi:hypothetical protein